jgi:hypothetical protein
MKNICLFLTTNSKEIYVKDSKIKIIKITNEIVPGKIFSVNSIDSEYGGEVCIPEFPHSNLNNIYLIVSDEMFPIVSSIKGKVAKAISLSEVFSFYISKESVVGSGKYGHIQNDSFDIIFDDNKNGAIFQILGEKEMWISEEIKEKMLYVESY